MWLSTIRSGAGRLKRPLARGRAAVGLGLCGLGLGLGLLLPLPAQAWGQRGHALVAALAAEQLSPAARQGVTRLLALEPGASLVSVASWADEHRNPASARWHFVNLPPDCSYDKQRDCPDGLCLVEALQHQVHLLGASSDDAQRLRALKYVVHLVADIHQPLHAGLASDKGGNTYQLRAWGRGTNLHALWDSGWIRHAGGDDAEWLSDLKAQPLPPAASSVSPVGMAQESCLLVHQTGFYPGRQVLPQDVERALPLVRERLKLAGARLAIILNGVWRPVPGPTFQARSSLDD